MHGPAFVGRRDGATIPREHRTACIALGGLKRVYYAVTAHGTVSVIVVTVVLPFSSSFNQAKYKLSTARNKPSGPPVVSTSVWTHLPYSNMLLSHTVRLCTAAWSCYEKDPCVIGRAFQDMIYVLDDVHFSTADLLGTESRSEPLNIHERPTICGWHTHWRWLLVTRATSSPTSEWQW